MFTVNLEKDPFGSKGFSAMKRSKTGIYNTLIIELIKQTNLHIN